MKILKIIFVFFLLWITKTFACDFWNEYIFHEEENYILTMSWVWISPQIVYANTYDPDTCDLISTNSLQFELNGLMSEYFPAVNKYTVLSDYYDWFWFKVWTYTVWFFVRSDNWEHAFYNYPNIWQPTTLDNYYFDTVNKVVYLEYQWVSFSYDEYWSFSDTYWQSIDYTSFVPNQTYNVWTFVLTTLTYGNEYPFVNICNFTNLNRPDWTICNNFDTNIITWTLNFDIQFENTWSILNFWDTLFNYRNDDKIWFDKQINFRQEIWDVDLFSFFVNSWSYFWTVSLSYWNYSNIYVQNFQIDFEWFDSYSIPWEWTLRSVPWYFDISCDTDWDWLISFPWEVAWCPMQWIQWVTSWIFTIFSDSFKSISKLIKTISTFWESTESNEFSFFLKTYASDDPLLDSLISEPSTVPLFSNLYNYIKYWILTIIFFLIIITYARRKKT